MRGRPLTDAQLKAANSPLGSFIDFKLEGAKQVYYLTAKTIIEEIEEFVDSSPDLPEYAVICISKSGWEYLKHLILQQEVTDER